MGFMGQARLNLNNIVALMVDRDPYARGLVAQMLRGFGISTILTADKGSEAIELLALNHPDITFIEGAALDMPTAELIKWVRGNPAKTLRFLPIIVLSGYTQLRMISAARDAGANLVVRKPVSPQVLFDRLVWVAASNGPFLEFLPITVLTGAFMRWTRLTASSSGKPTSPNPSPSRPDP